MQKNTIICLVLIILLGCSTILFLTSDYSNEKNITGSEAITTGYKFTLKEYCGKVAVFNYGADTPLEILNCPLSSLPEDAVLQLKAGINVGTQAELQKLIEAFD